MSEVFRFSAYDGLSEEDRAAVDSMHDAFRRLADTMDRVERESAMVEAYLADHPDEYARIDMLASSPDPKARMLAYDMMDDIRSMVSRRREGGHAGSPRGLDWGN